MWLFDIHFCYNMLPNM